MRDPEYKGTTTAHILLAGELLKTVKFSGAGNCSAWVDQDALQKLIQENWHRISTLAHAIHDAKPKEKTTREKLTPGNAATFDEFRTGIVEIIDRLEAIEAVFVRLRAGHHMSNAVGAWTEGRK